MSRGNKVISLTRILSHYRMLRLWTKRRYRRTLKKEEEVMKQIPAIYFSGEFNRAIPKKVNVYLNTKITSELIKERSFSLKGYSPAIIEQLGCENNLICCEVRFTGGETLLLFGTKEEVVEYFKERNK